MHPNHAAEFICPKVKPDHKMCLSTDSDLYQLIALVDQAIITKPAKAASSSLKSFADQYSINSSLHHEGDNILNDVNKKMLTTSFHMPPVTSDGIIYVFVGKKLDLFDNKISKYLNQFLFVQCQRYPMF